MSQAGPDDDILLEVARLHMDGVSSFKIGDHFGKPRSTIQGWIKTCARRGLLGTSPVMPGYQIKQVSTLQSDGETEKEWIKQGPESGEPFEVPPGHVIKGVSALVDGSGNTIQQWIKTKEDAAQSLEILRIAVDEFKQELTPVAPTKGPEHVNAALLNQYTVTDLHMGMLAWSEETRDSDYDLKIAEQLLLDWFSAAIGMAPDADTGVFAQLGDLMHHDSHESVTPAHGHVLSADSRLQKIVRVVIRVIRRIIGMLLQRHKHVHIIMADANHDPASSVWMRELLCSMYSDEPRITVENSPDTYYSYEWGKTGLYYHHGHRQKLEKVDSVFVGKFREMFGRCEHNYGHVGHLHSDGVVETNLMKVERHRTLAAPDAYASKGGWLSKRDAKVITYHREFGEVSRITLSPKMVQAV